MSRDFGFIGDDLKHAKIGCAALGYLMLTLKNVEIYACGADSFYYKALFFTPLGVMRIDTGLHGSDMRERGVDKSRAIDWLKSWNKSPPLVARVTMEELIKNWSTTELYESRAVERLLSQRWSGEEASKNHDALIDNSFSAYLPNSLAKDLKREAFVGPFNTKWWKDRQESQKIKPKSENKNT